MMSERYRDVFVVLKCLGNVAYHSSGGVGCLGAVGMELGCLRGHIEMSRELLSNSSTQGRVWNWKWTGGVENDGGPALGTVLGKPAPGSEQSFSAL